MRRLVIVVALLALATPAAAGGRSVKVGDNYFKPRAVTVGKGGTVTWQWTGRRRHNVYFYSGAAGGRPRGCSARRAGTCTRRFRRKGSYGFVCTLHGTMVGSVRVR